MMGTSSAAGMINSIRNNARYLRRKGMFKKEHSFTHLKEHYTKSAQGKISSQKVSASLLQTIRKKIGQQQSKSRRRFIIVLCIGLPLIAFGGYHIFNDFNFGFPALVSDTKGKPYNQQKKSTEKYMFYLEDGDKWLEKDNYYNAIFQYKKALEIYPKEYGVNYRLALAYSYQCQYKFKGCEKGKALTDNLNRQFPNDTDIQKLLALFEHWAVR